MKVQVPAHFSQTLQLPITRPHVQQSSNGIATLGNGTKFIKGEYDFKVYLYEQSYISTILTWFALTQANGKSF